MGRKYGHFMWLQQYLKKYTFFSFLAKFWHTMGGNTTLTIWKKFKMALFVLKSIGKNLRCHLMKNLLHNLSNKWLCYPIPLFGRSKFGLECPSSEAIFSKFSRIHVGHRNFSWPIHGVVSNKHEYRRASLMHTETPQHVAYDIYITLYRNLFHSLTTQKTMKILMHI